MRIINPHQGYGIGKKNCTFSWFLKIFPSCLAVAQTDNSQRVVITSEHWKSINKKTLHSCCIYNGSGRCLYATVFQAKAHVSREGNFVKCCSSSWKRNINLIVLFIIFFSFFLSLTTTLVESNLLLWRFPFTVCERRFTHRLTLN